MFAAMIETMSPAEMTLEELRAVLTPLLPQEAAFDGWTDAALQSAGRALGVPEDRPRLAFPGGAIDMIDAWFAAIDLAMVAALSPERIAAMKIRERIREMVLARLAAIGPHREALRGALAVLAQPQNAAQAVRLGWRAADRIWRLAGDTATDFNHYTKRATLAALYASTLIAWMDDDSEDWAETRAFLDRRIDNVMQFEKLKARFRGDPERRFSPIRLLGRLRYPAV